VLNTELNLITVTVKSLSVCTKEHTPAHTNTHPRATHAHTPTRHTHTHTNKYMCACVCISFRNVSLDRSIASSRVGSSTSAI